MHVDKIFQLENQGKQLMIFGDLMIYVSNSSIITIDQETNFKASIDVDEHIDFIFHPPTYLNKILVAKKNILELWNIKS